MQEQIEGFFGFFQWTFTWCDYIAFFYQRLQAFDQSYDELLFVLSCNSEEGDKNSVLKHYMHGDTWMHLPQSVKLR